MHKPPLTFAHFVDLPENRLARLAVREVATHLITAGSALASSNPLLLYGPPGSGKTHLVSALVEEVQQLRPEAATVHLAAVDLGQANEFTADVEKETAGPTDDLSTLAEADLVVIEDLQHLPPSAAERFTRLVDDLQAQGQQMIFTANAGPQQLESRHGKFPVRLVNRLAGGMVVRLESPAAKSRKMLLRSFAGELPIADEIIDWLAEHLTEGGRQLIGAMRQVEALARIHPLLDVELVAQHFQPQTEVSRVTVERIAQRVSGYFQVPPKELISKRRHRCLMIPRQVSMYLARQLTDLSLEQIGAYFGGRDHTTVLHACRKVEEALTCDAALSGAVRELKGDLS